MPTGVYERSETQIEAWKQNRLLGQGWNKGLTFKKQAKTVPKLCAYCGNEFLVGKNNQRYKFCTRECKIGALKRNLKERYAVDPEFRERCRSRQILARFRISKQEYDEKLRSQACRCAICGVHQNDVKRKFAIDHDHLTGKVRDLLCASCNTALGAMRDSQGLLRMAANYLERHAVRDVLGKDKR